MKIEEFKQTIAQLQRNLDDAKLTGHYHANCQETLDIARSMLAHGQPIPSNEANKVINKIKARIALNAFDQFMSACPSKPNMAPGKQAPKKVKPCI